MREVRSQLATEETRFKELGVELDNSEEIRGDIQAQLADLKQKSATAEKDLPEAADILDQLRKAKGKKFTASLVDVESILEILKES